MFQPFYLLLTQPDHHSSMRSSTRQQQQALLHLPTIPEDCEVQVVCDEQYQKTRRQRHLEGLLIKVARVLLLSVLAIALLTKSQEVAESVASAAHAEAHHALLEEDSTATAPGELRHLLRGSVATPSVVATPAVAMVETMPRHISTTVWQQHDEEPPQAPPAPQPDMAEQPLRIGPQYDDEEVEEEEDASPALWRQPEEPQQPQEQEPQEKTEWQPQQIAPSEDEQPLEGLEEVDEEEVDDDETTSYIPHDDFLVPEDAEPTPVFNEEQQYYEEESSVVAEPQRSLDEVQVQPPLQEGTNNVDVVATTVDDVEAPQQQQQQPPLAEHETFLIPPMRR